MKKYAVLSLRKKLIPSLSLPFLSPINSKKNKFVTNKSNILNYFIQEEEEKIKEICDYNSPACFFSMKQLKLHQFEQVEKRKSISSQFIFQSSPNQNQEKELTTNDKMKQERIQLKEINDLKTKINSLKEEFNTKTMQINTWTQDIDNWNLELKVVQLVNDKMTVPPGIIGSFTKKKKETNILRNLTNIEISIKTQKELIKQYTSDTKNIKASMKQLKIYLIKKQKYLLDYYHNILVEGKDTRTEGLSWVIKAIWNLDSDVQMKYLPTFLDEKLSITYLTIHLKLINYGKSVKKYLN